MRNFVIGCIVPFTTAGTAFSETKEPPKKLAVDLGGGVKMELVLIPAGEFKMGSAESAEATGKDEHPQHRVRITKPFYLGTYHVTRGQFRQFVADSGYKTDAEEEEDDPTGPDSGDARVLRGSDWCCGPDGSRSARRGWLRPNTRDFSDRAGFRVARTQ